MTAENHLAEIQTARQRLQSFGPGNLTTAELLSLVLGAGKGNEQALTVAQRLLTEHGGLIGLARLNLYELCSESGIGLARAAQIEATLELGKRMVLEAVAERPQIMSAGDAAKLLMVEMAHLEQEHLRVLLLDTRNHLLGDQLVYIGNVNTSVIRAGEVFREAVRRNCPAIIVAHNHPSGDCSPSSEDLAVTKALIEAGKLLDIQLLDHLVIGQGRFVSLKERGLAFS